LKKVRNKFDVRIWRNWFRFYDRKVLLGASEWWEPKRTWNVLGNRMKEAQENKLLVLPNWMEHVHTLPVMFWTF